MKYLFSIILIVNTILLFSQSDHFVTVSLDKMNIAYIGFPNPIKISVEGYKNEDLTVALNSYNSPDTIIPIEDGKYDLRVTGGKEAFIIIKSNSDTLGKIKVLIQRIPDPKPNYSLMKDEIPTENVISKNDLLNDFYLTTEPEQVFVYDCEFIITNYIFSHTDTAKNINKTIECEGNRLNKIIKKYISKLPAGSEISFTIFCVGPDNEKRKLEPLVLQLKS